MTDINSNNLRVESINLNDVNNIFSGTIDPSVTGKAAGLGSVFLRNTNELFIKVGALDTDWEPVIHVDSAGVVDGGVIFWNATSSQWETTQLFVSGTKQTIQSVFGTVPALSGTTVIVIATTAPLVTEGTELWSQTFTPSQTGGEIQISQSLAFLVTNAASDFVVALFRDNVCIGVMNDSAANGGAFQTVSFIIKDPGAPTGGVPVTYSTRVGKSGGGATWYVNSHDTIATVFGSTLLNNAYTIDEVVTL